MYAHLIPAAAIVVIAACSRADQRATRSSSNVDTTSTAVVRSPPPGEVQRPSPDNLPTPIEQTASADVAKQARERAGIAGVMQSSLREEGCAGCRAWVSGKNNVTLHILDPMAPTTPNDYKGTPVAHFDAGFDTVIYYSRRGVIYAKHSR